MDELRTTQYDEILSTGLADALERLDAGLMTVNEKINLCETLGPFRDTDTQFMRRCLFLGWFMLSSHEEDL